jgi:hypothetical protein
MHKKTKIKKGFYPISYADIKRMIGYCEEWGYGNKDTCKYVAENTIEQLELNYPELPINKDLHSDLISITHDINSGANVKGKELLLSIR